MSQRRGPLSLGADGALPYSKGLLVQALLAVGVRAEPAYELALRVEADLRRRGAGAIELERLEELATGVLGDGAARAMRRLRRFRDLVDLDVPIVVLIGGATGTGKSTVATEVAHRLGITRVTSTDFIRQTMRAYFSHDFLPSVHYSSFEAEKALPAAEREAGDPLLIGFIDQTRRVLVGVQASIDRALAEGWSLVLEGVHLVPGMIAAPTARALVVHAVLAIENEDIHAQHFWIRDDASGGTRPHDKYVAHLADIRHLQDFVVEEAAKEGVPVIQNGNIEEAIGEVMELVFDRADELREAR